MRILDDRYRLFGIINPVDLVVVLVVLAGLFTAANLLFGKAEPVAVKDTVPVKFSVLYQAVPVETYNEAGFKKGDTVSKVGGRPMGTLVDWSAVPTPMAFADREGNLQTGEVSYLLDVTIDVEGTAEKTANGLLAGEVLLKDNLFTQIATTTFQGDGRIFGVTSGAQQ